VLFDEDFIKIALFSNSARVHMRVSSHKKINPIATVVMPELGKILCQKLLFS
jgi:hypothetical protein